MRTRLILVAHHLIQREIRFCIAKFLESGDNGILGLYRQSAESIRFGEFSPVSADGDRTDVVVVHELDRQRMRLLLSRNEQGLSEINGLHFLGFLFSLVLRTFFAGFFLRFFLVIAVMMAAASTFVFAIMVAIVVAAVTVVVTAAFVIVVIIAEFIRPRMESCDTDKETIDIPLNQDVGLVFIKTVVPLFKNLLALLNALDIVDGYLN